MRAIRCLFKSKNCTQSQKRFSILCAGQRVVNGIQNPQSQLKQNLIFPLNPMFEPEIWVNTHNFETWASVTAVQCCVEAHYSVVETQFLVVDCRIESRLWVNAHQFQTWVSLSMLCRSSLFRSRDSILSSRLQDWIETLSQCSPISNLSLTFNAV